MPGDETFKSKAGITVRGMCNGTDSYISTKSGVENFSVIVVIPGSKDNIEVGLPGPAEAAQYKQGQAVELRCKPRFYGGRLTGLSLA